MREDSERYQCTYSNYLPWSKRVWVLQPGDQLTKEGKAYTVVQVTRSPVPGELPLVEVEERHES